MMSSQNVERNVEKVVCLQCSARREAFDDCEITLGVTTQLMCESYRLLIVQRRCNMCKACLVLNQ
jgi:hypothetical protein